MIKVKHFINFSRVIYLNSKKYYSYWRDISFLNKVTQTLLTWLGVYQNLIQGEGAISPNVPISPKIPNIADFFKYKLLCGRSEWRHCQDWISKIFFFDLYLVAYLILRILEINFIWTYCKTPYKLKNCSTYDVISNAYAFFTFKQNNLFLSPYRRKSQYRRKCPISPNFSDKKLTAILGPLYTN